MVVKIRYIRAPLCMVGGKKYADFSPINLIPEGVRFLYRIKFFRTDR